MFHRLGDGIRNFMAGRNGIDRLAWFLCIFGLVLNIVGNLTHLGIFTLLAYIPLVLCLFRVFSRNTGRRYEENLRFNQFGARLKGRKNFHYFSCPSCKTRVRVPRGKGKIKITCPSCHNSFVKKS